MRRFALVSAILAAAALASGQETAQPKPQEPTAAEQPKTEPATTEAAKTPTALPVTVDSKTFTLGPEDVIFVRVWREPDLSGTLVIRPDGRITLPLIRDVNASGLTPELLSTEITKRLSEFINNPQVLVQVQAVRSKRYLISGEISRPGAFPLAVPTTVFEAIGLAGGFRDFANKKKITIVRGDQRLKFNYNDVVKGKNLSQNVYLENGDKIVVP
jgi:polysaccharide export outer membrane protein